MPSRIPIRWCWRSRAVRASGGFRWTKWPPSWRPCRAPDAVVQFVAQRALGQVLAGEKGDPDGLQHFDRAIALLDRACSRCGRYGFFVDDIYRQRMEACARLGRVEEAQTTALAGARHFTEVGRYNESVASLYYQCVMEILKPADDQQALAICDAFLKGFEKSYWLGRNLRPAVAAKRLEILTRRAGKTVPESSGLRLARGTERSPSLRLAAAGKKLWLVSRSSSMLGRASVYRPDADETKRLPQVPYAISSVAAMDDSVWFGGYEGLYKLDSEGRLLKHYDQQDSAMPGRDVDEVCVGGGKVYFVFRGSPHRGVAVLDPAGEKISVLAPSSREVRPRSEPLDAEELRWDAVTPQLHAFSYGYWLYQCPRFDAEFRWSPQDPVWHGDPIERAPRFVASAGDETLVVSPAADATEFRFLKSRQTVKAAVPLPELMGQPAFDFSRIWVPSAGGLFEIDRASGAVSWLAYKPGLIFQSVLSVDGRLYLATSGGLYYREHP